MAAACLLLSWLILAACDDSGSEAALVRDAEGQDAGVANPGSDLDATADAAAWPTDPACALRPSPRQHIRIDVRSEGSCEEPSGVTAEVTAVAPREVHLRGGAPCEWEVVLAGPLEGIDLAVGATVELRYSSFDDVTMVTLSDDSGLLLMAAEGDFWTFSTLTRDAWPDLTLSAENACPAELDGPRCGEQTIRQRVTFALGGDEIALVDGQMASGRLVGHTYTARLPLAYRADDWSCGTDGTDGRYTLSLVRRR